MTATYHHPTTQPSPPAQDDRSARRHLVFSLLLCALLLLPLVQWLAQPIPAVPIKGLATPPLPNPPSVRRVLSGQFQREVEQFTARGTGLWPTLVRVANQITLSVFNQIGTSKNGSVLVGADKTLFQPMYLRSFNRRRTVPETTARAAAKNLQQLHRQLKKRGIPLVLLVSPNAIALYPEIVPPSLIDPTRLTRSNSYELGLPLMKKRGVPVVDMFGFFSKRRDQFPTRIFPRTGSHWNDHASCIATRAVLRKLTSLSARASSWPTISCDAQTWNVPPPGEDTDLLDIANVLAPDWYVEPGVTVKHPPSPAPSSRKVLLVGTSFLFAIQSHLERAGAVQEAGLYFYARSFRKGTQQHFRPLPLNRVNWDEFWDYDAIIIEINEASLVGAGHGFVPAALNALKQAPTPT